MLHAKARLAPLRPSASKDLLLGMPSVLQAASSIVLDLNVITEMITVPVAFKYVVG